MDFKSSAFAGILSERYDLKVTVGQVAARSGVSTSAIRYYEQIGLLPRAPRKSGRRVYGEPVLARLALIAFATSAGFTLHEVKTLVSANGKPLSARWKRLAEAKLVELEAAERRIGLMRMLLRRALACECLEAEECGRFIGQASR